MKENNFISEEVKDLSPFCVSMKKKIIVLSHNISF